MSVLIIDYELCNLNSIKRAVEECGGNVIVSANPQDIKQAERIILPGVGAFADGIRNLNDQGWSEAIRHEVINSNVPLLGICLGMQLLADYSEEGGEFAGLGLISGRVVRLQPQSQDERIPHVGWNEIYKIKDCPLLEGIADGTDFYFVHSYHFKLTDATDAAAFTPYCNKFASVVQHNRIYGTQFHPEKSLPAGFRVIKNFLERG